MVAEHAVNGQEYWTTLQMDETALPVVLAWWLGRTAAEDWRHVQRAADFIVAKGPQTDQERWENQSGWSPNTIATEIAGLICAADIARKHGATAKAATYEQTADDVAGSRSSPGRRRTPARTRRSRTTCA